MCELLGMSAKRRRAVNALLREFYSHAEAHPHGWGLARFSDAGMPSVEKEPIRATESAYLKNRLSEPIDEKTFLAHIRFATVGHLEYKNCHPFTTVDNRGRMWTLAHNGTIFNGAALNDYMGIQYGDTDSERVLLHLIGRIDHAQNHRHHALDADERFDVLASAIADLAKGNKLNLLIYDGEVLYAHVNFRDSLYFLQDEDAVLFSTRPLGAGNWKPVPFTRLVAVQDGELIREGKPHGHEYIYNSEDYRLIYMDFARL